MNIKLNPQSLEILTKKFSYSLGTHADKDFIKLGARGKNEGHSSFS